MRLQVDQVSAGFASRPVVHDVSFDVWPGEIVTILGASGSGKTTLLRAIAGLHPMMSGRILLGTEDLTAKPAQKRGIGLVPQEGALFPNLSVAANVGYGVARAKRAERVAHMLDLIGLPERAATMPHELSGGQRHRVALARALAPAPPVLLLDEPFSSLDAELRTSLRMDIARIITQTSTAVVLVTHDVNEALTMSDRIVVLDDARAVAIGTPADLYARPPSMDVAKKLGAASIVDGAVVSKRQVQTQLGVLETLHPVETSEPVDVLLRPENLRVRAPLLNESEGCVGQVVWTEFRGETLIVHVQLADDLTVAAHAHPAEKWVVGDTVRVEVLEPVHVLPALSRFRKDECARPEDPAHSSFTAIEYGSV